MPTWNPTEWPSWLDMPLRREEVPILMDSWEPYRVAHLEYQVEQLAFQVESQRTHIQALLSRLTELASDYYENEDDRPLQRLKNMYDYLSLEAGDTLRPYPSFKRTPRTQGKVSDV
jgi:hypothetical protein